MKNSTIILLISIVLIGLFAGEIQTLTQNTINSVKDITGNIIEEEYTLAVGDSVAIAGKTVTLINVGSQGSIIIKVDGVIDTVPAETTKVVNDLSITIIKTQYSNVKTERSAVLKISTEVCEDTTWSQDPSTVCKEEKFEQTSNCGNTQQSIGTKVCSEGYICHTYLDEEGVKAGKCIKEQIECIDSDSGKDYYYKGYIEIDGIKSYDECNPGPNTTPNTLLEYYCTGLSQEPGLGIKYNCEVEGKVCQDGACIKIQSECTPDCAGKECGLDGCGGSCGTCSTNKPICQSGICKTETTQCTDTCRSLNYECEIQTICGIETDCGTCPQGYECIEGIEKSKCKEIQPIITSEITCELTNAYWSTTSAIEGEQVILTVEGNNCEEEKIIFEIKESEVGSDTFITSPQTFQISNIISIAEWIAIYIDDGLLQGDPEYYFTAYLDSDNSIKIDSNKLTVAQLRRLIGSKTYNILVVEFAPKDIIYGNLYYCSGMIGHYLQTEKQYCENIINEYSFLDILNNPNKIISFDPLQESYEKDYYSLFYINDYLRREANIYGISDIPYFNIELKGPFTLYDLPPKTIGAADFDKIDSYFDNKINELGIDISNYDFVTVIYFNDYDVLSNIDKHKFTPHVDGIRGTKIYISADTYRVMESGFYHKIITHELLHLFGALDHYVLAGVHGGPSWCSLFECCIDPDGVPNPGVYPQTKNCMMCAGGIVVELGKEEYSPQNFIEDVIICDKTAQELGWK